MFSYVKRAATSMPRYFIYYAVADVMLAIFISLPATPPYIAAMRLRYYAMMLDAIDDAAAGCRYAPLFSSAPQLALLMLLIDYCFSPCATHSQSSDITPCYAAAAANNRLMLLLPAPRALSMPSDAALRSAAFTLLDMLYAA